MSESSSASEIRTVELVHQTSFEGGDDLSPRPPAALSSLIHNHLAPNGSAGNNGHPHAASGGSDVIRRRDEEVTDVTLVTEALSAVATAANDAEENDAKIASNGDEGDAWGFGKSGNSVSTSALPSGSGGGGGGGMRVGGIGLGVAPPRRPGPAARMPCEKESEVYNMRHRRRGVAFIFNHKHFDQRLGLKQRNGTDADRDNLRLTLRQLDFEVRVYDDLPWKDIDRTLENAALEDHSDADCILVTVLSHGELGILYASDHAYKPDRLWTQFNAENCPSLAGKPKLFFIQACQGDQLDGGCWLDKTGSDTTQTDSSSMSYKIPTHADFLIVYSTIPGFYSWRNTSAGSWFVQALCYVLQRKGRDKDLLSNLTHVARKVAFDFQSNTPGDFVMHEKKQIPCITSMLTRDIYFHQKI